LWWKRELCVLFARDDQGRAPSINSPQL
jgi:hypothetical protein